MNTLQLQPVKPADALADPDPVADAEADYVAVAIICHKAKQGALTQ